MRIGLVSLHTSPTETPGQGDAGGMNVVVREAALALERLGHEVAIATRASGRVPAGITRLEGSRSVLVHALSMGEADVAKSRLPALVPEFGAALASTPGFADADVLHAHYWLSGLAALESLTGESARNIPVVTTLHTVAAEKNRNLAPGDTPEPEVRLQGERMLVDKTTMVAGSTSEMQSICEGYGDPLAESRVIHPGVDTELFRPAEAPRGKARHEGGHHGKTQHGNVQHGGVQHGQPHLLVLGRVQPLKGQDLALDAFETLLGAYPDLAENASLTIAGEPTPGAEAFHEALITRAAHLGGRVTFLPAQSRLEAADLIRSSDLVLMPSHSETFGLVALEAAASGVPVLATDTTGLREAVRPGVSGELIEGRDPRIWAQAMAEIVRRPQFRATARAHALQLDWNAHARALESLYRTLINRVT